MLFLVFDAVRSTLFYYSSRLVVVWKILPSVGPVVRAFVKLGPDSIYLFKSHNTTKDIYPETHDVLHKLPKSQVTE